MPSLLEGTSVMKVNESYDNYHRLGRWDPNRTDQPEWGCIYLEFLPLTNCVIEQEIYCGL